MKQIFIYLFFYLLSLQTLSAQFITDTVLTLQNIEIQGQRFPIINSGSVKQLSVQENITGGLGSASDVLRQLPAVTSDIEGTTYFRGSTKTTQLISGIPYGFMEEQGGDLLIQLPAFFFKRITLLPQPDLSFIPDGESGILSFSTSPVIKESIPFQIIVGAGLKERYTAGAHLNLNPGRWQIAANYNYRREYRERSFYKLTNNATGSTEMNNNATARPNVHVTDLSIGYSITKQDFLSVYSLYQHMGYNRYGGINNIKKNAAGDILNKIIRHRYNKQEQEAYAIEGSWRHLFEKEGQMTVRFNYNNFLYDEDNHYENEQPSSKQIVAQDNLGVVQNKHNYFLTAAFSKPLGDNYTLKAGYIGRIQNDQYTAVAENLTNGNWIPNASKSTDFSFTRYINLAYSSLQKKMGALFVETGLQAEHTFQEISTTSPAMSPKRNQIYLYPKATLKYLTSNAGNFSLGYQQRTNRPLSLDLNPFTDRTDATYIKQGNPDLKAELIHLVELSYSIGKSTYSATSTLYYRHKTNRIMDIAAQVNNDIIWTKQNLGNSNTYGFEVSVNWQPLRWFNAGASADIYRDEIDGRSIGYDAQKKMNCFLTKANIQIKLSPTTLLQGDGFYISDQLTAQGEIKSRYSVNAGIAQYLADRKLKATLSITNLFDSLKETTVISTGAFQQTQIRNRDACVSWLTLTYNL